MKRDQTEANFFSLGLKPADGILIASDLQFMGTALTFSPSAMALPPTWPRLLP